MKPYKLHTINFSARFLRTKFSQIRLLHFANQDFLLAMPTFGGCMQYLCSQLQQRHAEMLASKSKCFAQGQISSLGPSGFHLLELINYVTQAGDAPPTTH